MYKKIAAFALVAALIVSLLASCTNSPKNTGSQAASNSPPASGSAPAANPVAQTTLTVTAAGTISPEKTIKEVIIEADGVILENATLDKVTVSQKLGEGSATLNSVHADCLEILGGGKNSIHANDSAFDTIEMQSENLTRFVLGGTSTVNKLNVSTESILEISGTAASIEIKENSGNSILDIKSLAEISELTIFASSEISLHGNIKNLVLGKSAEGTSIAMFEKSVIKTLACDVKTDITGKGEINDIITDNKNKINTEIKPGSLTVVKKPVQNGKPADIPAIKATPSPKPVASATPSPAPAPTPTPVPTPTPTPTPVPITVTALTVINGTFSENVTITEGGNEKISLNGLVIKLAYSDLTSEVVSYADFAKNSITLSTAHDSILLHGKNPVIVTHTPSGKSAEIFITARYPINTIVSNINRDCEFPYGYTAYRTTFDLLKPTSKVIYKIFNKDTVFAQVTHNITAAGTYSVLYTFRALGNISAAEAEALNKLNSNRIPQDTMYSEEIVIIYDGVEYNCSLFQDAYLSQHEFELAYFSTDEDKNKAVELINKATGIAEMQAAISAALIPFNLPTFMYNGLSDKNKTEIATIIYGSGSNNYTVYDARQAIINNCSGRSSMINSILVNPDTEQIIDNNAAGNKLTATVDIYNPNDCVTTLEWYKTNKMLTDMEWYAATKDGRATKCGDGTEFTPLPTTTAGAMYYFVVVNVSGNGIHINRSNPVKVTTKEVANGIPSITGIAKIGETLKINTSKTNLTGTLTYQWLANGIDIAGAVSDTFIPTDVELGKKISCKVSSKNQTGILTTSQTENVIESDVPPPITVTGIEVDDNSYVSPAVITTGGNEKIILDQLAVTLIYSDFTKKTVCYDDFAANGIILSKAHGSLLVHGKNPVTVTHTPSDKSAEIIITARYPINEIVTSIETNRSGTLYGYNVEQISFNLIKAGGKITHKVYASNPDFSTTDFSTVTYDVTSAGKFKVLNTYRALGIVSAAEADTLNKQNDNRLPVGTKYKQSISLVYDGMKYEIFSYSQTFQDVITQDQYDGAFYSSDLDKTIALAAINGAADINEMQAAIKASLIPLHIYTWIYNNLSAANQLAVATEIYGSGSNSYTIESFEQAINQNCGSRRSSIESISINPAVEQIIDNDTAGSLLTAVVDVNRPEESTTTVKWYKSNEPVITDGLVAIAMGKAIKCGDGETFTPPATITAGNAYYFALAEISGNGNDIKASFPVKTVVKAKAEGTVIISGNAHKGETLIADIADTNLKSGNISYQWKADDEVILGATSRTYRLTASEIGKKISVTASSDVLTGLLTSAKTNAVIDSDAPDAPLLSETPTDNSISFAPDVFTITSTVGSAISGTAYEYRLNSDTVWSDLVSGTAINNLSAGEHVITVRAKQTESSSAGTAASLSIRVLDNTHNVTIILMKNGTVDIASAESITLVSSGNEISTSSSNGLFKAKVANGTYKVLFGSKKIDTGVEVIVSDADAVAAVEIFNVKIVRNDIFPVNDSSLTFTYNELPFSNNDTVVKGGSIVLTAQGNGASAYKYEWIVNGVKDESAVSNVYNLSNISSKIDISCIISAAE